MWPGNVKRGILLRVPAFLEWRHRRIARVKSMEINDRFSRGIRRRYFIAIRTIEMRHRNISASLRLAPVLLCHHTRLGGFHASWSHSSGAVMLADAPAFTAAHPAPGDITSKPDLRYVYYIRIWFSSLTRCSLRETPHHHFGRAVHRRVPDISSSDLLAFHLWGYFLPCFNAWYFKVIYFLHSISGSLSLEHLSAFFLVWNILSRMVAGVSISRQITSQCRLEEYFIAAFLHNRRLPFMSILEVHSYGRQ